jgi:hypothetical protein
MTDLTSLDGLKGVELTDEQIQGLLNQIDLDIANLVREGKLSAGKYASPAGNVDRGASLQGLIQARDYFTKLLQSRGGWEVTQYEQA